MTLMRWLYVAGVLTLIAAGAVILLAALQEPRSGTEVAGTLASATTHTQRTAKANASDPAMDETLGGTQPERAGNAELSTSSIDGPPATTQRGRTGSTEVSEPATGDSPDPKEVTVVKGVYVARSSFNFEASLEEMVLKADLIARVRLRSVEPAGAKMAYDYTARDGLEYAGSLKLTMNALEYIKGTGGAELVAYAYGYLSGRDNDNAFVASTEAVAARLGRWLLTTRDARWDDREAIVLLRYNEPEGHYYLGLVSAREYIPDGGLGYQFTVAGTMWKSWLPDASPLRAQRAPLRA